MFDAEFALSPPDDAAGSCAASTSFVIFGNPANLRANNDTDPTNNVGNTMYGYSGEVAYHFPLGTILYSDWEAVPFYRYTYQNLQTAGFAGTDLNRRPAPDRCSSTTSASRSFRRRNSCSRGPIRG